MSDVYVCTCRMRESIHQLGHLQVQLSSVSAADVTSGKAVPIRCRLQKFDYEPSMSAVEVCTHIRNKLLEVQVEFADICEAYMNKAVK